MRALQGIQNMQKGEKIRLRFPVLEVERYIVLVHTKLRGLSIYHFHVSIMVVSVALYKCYALWLYSTAMLAVCIWSVNKPIFLNCHLYTVHTFFYSIIFWMCDIKRLNDVIPHQSHHLCILWKKWDVFINNKKKNCLGFAFLLSKCICRHVCCLGLCIHSLMQTYMCALISAREIRGGDKLCILHSKYMFAEGVCIIYIQECQEDLKDSHELPLQDLQTRCRLNTKFTFFTWVHYHSKV